MDLGDTLPFRSDVYDKPIEDGGVLTNASSAVLTVTLPDGSTVTPSVTNPSTGKYACDYTTLVSSPSGRYTGQWLFTFPSGATTSYVETFDVGGSLVTVDEAIAHLRAAGIITTENDLDQLQWLTFVASDAVERDLGRTYQRKSFTETYSGGTDAVVLRHTPVLSVTSVTVSGTAISDYLLDDFGILYRSATGCFTWGRSNVVVSYVAGSVNPPPCVRFAALGVVQSMWQQSQQADHPSVDSVDGFSAIALAAPSRQVRELQAAYNSLRAPGI